ncbi:Fic family protein [Roseomonas populi]|uniref:Fic family protein n=1 Tax=Roseomonas populi TaxID=3121582 RepID=A0ABT1XA47_9PROT|nr:Fic family protein [Roseomonas pecuniae]MCR0984950.1 Fic family protein [Roseomonas pecuniae]
MRLPPPYDAHYGVHVAPPATELALPPEAIRSIQAAAAALAGLNAVVAARPSAYHVTRVLVRDEATRSSAIEGTQATLDELLSADAVLEGTGDLEHGAGTRDELETVRAYAVALERFLARPHPIDAAVISGLHRAVFTGSAEFADGRHGRPGAWREKTVWIGSGRDISRSTFNPPPHPLVPGLIEEHVGWLRDTEEGTMAPATPIRLALAHAHFEAIHPFAEGNGRVGRMLLSLMLAAEGHVAVPLSRVLDRRRSDYYEALKLAQQKLDFVPLSLLMCDAIQESAEQARDLDERLSLMPASWRDPARWPAGRPPRRDGAASRMLDVLPYHPVVTTGLVERELEVSGQAANLAVAALAAAGILVERTGYRRNRVFVCPEALAAIVGGEA